MVRGKWSRTLVAALVSASMACFGAPLQTFTSAPGALLRSPEASPSELAEAPPVEDTADEFPTPADPDGAGSTGPSDESEQTPAPIPDSPAEEPVELLAFEEIPTPSIDGFEAPAQGLVAQTDGWLPQPDDFRFQWYAGDERVRGAQMQLYTPRASDYGKQITVRVTGLKEGYAAAARTSAPVVPLQRLATRVPAIVGLAAPGR